MIAPALLSMLSLTIACPEIALSFPIPPTVVQGAELTVIFEDNRFFEGPTWDPRTDSLFFTAFGERNQQLLRRDASGQTTVFKDQTEGVNGTFLSDEGKILGAQAYGHRLISYSIEGDEEVILLDDELNQPNDLCQAPDGTIYFTDPDFAERSSSVIYRLTADGTAEKLAEVQPLPNGLISSNDGKTLYVGDSAEKRWYAYPIRSDGSLGDPSVFFDPQVESTADPDGMTIDASGNLYFTGRGGVWVVSPDGEALGLIPVPEFCSNVTFGGPNGKTLFLTCQSKVYSLAMNVRGGRSAGRLDVRKLVREGFVGSDGVKIHYAEIGEGPLLVMLHGFPDFWYTWREQMPALAEHFRVVAPDLRGYNKSDAPEGVENYALDLLVGDVEAILDHFEAETATIVGHDWGGIISWTFAMEHPERTERLVILNLPHPRGLFRELATNPAQQRNSQYARNFQAEDAASVLPASALSMWVRDPEARAVYNEAFALSSVEGMLNYYKANYPKPPYEFDETAAAEFPQVQCPVLMFHGLDDTALLPGALSGTWDWIDGDLTLITVPGADHFIQQAAPNRVTRTMKWWLTQSPWSID